MSSPETIFPPAPPPHQHLPDAVADPLVQALLAQEQLEFAVLVGSRATGTRLHGEPAAPNPETVQPTSPHLSAIAKTIGV